MCPEYQYNLKDHLGNVRLTFTTKNETETSLATLETANASSEQGKFLYYNEAIKVNHPPFDHTNAGTTYYSTRLTGGSTNAKYGLTKTLSIMPGDVVNMEVYAKYLDPTSTNWTAALNNFITAINGGTAPAGTIVDGGAAGSIGGGTYPISPINHAAETGTPPKAYLNYIVFDRAMTTVLDIGYSRITANSREYGQDGAHDRLALNYTAKEPGYIYIYLSNENPTAVEVYFDDFKVEHVKSPVVQVDDYYPFGLTFNSYSRENSVANKRLYNDGSEIQDALNLNVYQTQFRILDQALGRWWQLDPKADSLEDFTPYNYAFNNPIRYHDPKGDCPPNDPHCAGRGGMNPVRAALQNNVVSNVRAAGNSASNIVSGGLGVQAAGIGAKIKIAGVVHIEAQGKAGVGELSVSSNGPDAKISAVTTDFGAQIGPLGGSYSQNDMAYDGNTFQMREGDGSFSAGSVQYGNSSNEVSIGGALGNLSVEVSANLSAAGDAINSTVEAVKGFFLNLLPNTWQE
jgi:RHS repeat-associated protein